MDELEKRLLAVELLLIEVAPWLAEGALHDAATAIRAGLHADLTDDEREVRMYAIQLLTDGKRRFEPGAIGGWVRGLH